MDLWRRLPGAVTAAMHLTRLEETRDRNNEGREGTGESLCVLNMYQQAPCFRGQPQEARNLLDHNNVRGRNPGEAFPIGASRSITGTAAALCCAKLCATLR